MKILDTDHCIAFLRGRIDLLNLPTELDDLAVTSISVAELVHGAHKSNRVVENLAGLELFLSHLTILSFNQSTAYKFGQIKAQLEMAGEKLADLDLQIAAIALQADSPLVTHNQKHFARIPNLLLEDWL